MALLGLAIFFGFSLGLGVWVLLSGLAKVQSDAVEQDEAFSESPLFQAALPIIQALGRVIEPIGAFDGTREGLNLKLLRAGRSDSITPDEFLGFMVLCGGVGGGVGLYFQLMIGGGIEIVLALAILVSFLPLLSLRESVAKRQKAIRKILPYTLDLLCLAVEAGLDFTAALNRIGERLPQSPFRQEVRILTRDLNMGKTRSQALRDMEFRIGLEELTSVVSALVQADELGASLGPTLRIQSNELNRKRFQRAEKKAMQAPVLMLIPLVLFIFPLVFLIIFAPIALKVMEMGVF